MIAGFESALRLPTGILPTISLAYSSRWDKVDGVRSIDVGCIWLNLTNHSRAFEKLD